MKLRFRSVSALIAGAAAGAFAVQALHAQATPPAYVIVSIQSVTDAAGMKAVVEKASPEAVLARGGKYVIRTNDITAFDGTPPQRFVVIAFDSKAKAQDWENSAGTKEITALRSKAAKSVSFMVEGLTN
jgi:uncharacterized protein (DUF1330 family)